MPAHFEVSPCLVGVAAGIEMEQCVIGGVGHGDGCLQLVGHVMGEVRLHLVYRAQPSEGMDEIPERGGEHHEREQ